MAPAIIEENHYGWYSKFLPSAFSSIQRKKRKKEGKATPSGGYTSTSMRVSIQRDEYERERGVVQLKQRTRIRFAFVMIDVNQSIYICFLLFPCCQLLSARMAPSFYSFFFFIYNRKKIEIALHGCTPECAAPFKKKKTFFSSHSVLLSQGRS